MKEKTVTSPRPSRSPLASRTVAIQLGLAFSLLVALLITVGDLGIRRMDRINADLQDIVGARWTKLRLSREALTYSNRNSRITMQVFLLKDLRQINSLLALRAQNSKNISTLMIDIEGLCSSEEEKRLFVAIKDARGPYVDGYGRALHLLLEEKNRDTAETVMTEQTTPALLRYHAAWDDLVRFQGDQIDLAVRQSRVRYAAARHLASLIILAAVLLSSAIGFLVIERVLREMTARLRDEKESLRIAHQDAEVFINTVPSILIGLDSEARVSRWNSAATRAFGLAGTEVLGKKLPNCGVKWLWPDMEEKVHSWCSELGSRRCDQVPFEINGENRLLGLTITSVHVGDKQSPELLVIGSDITERNALEVQLRQAQKLESVGQLAAGIAHEINTPTQYIGDNVRFLKDAFIDFKSLLSSYERLLAISKTNASASETVDNIVAELARVDAGYLLDEIPKAIDQTIEGVSQVARLVGAMKEFSHPGTKEKIPVDLNHAVESTLTVARNEWKYVADVETDFDLSMPLISCQPGELNQVILNLIVNAAHAIADVVRKDNSQKGKIRVQTRNWQEWAEIRIEDTGSGIPQKVRARVFDPFFTTKEVGKGTGQGLAIARSVVVDKHGGSIDFETEEGKGTTFIIRLPHDGKALRRKEASA